MEVPEIDVDFISAGVYNLVIHHKETVVAQHDFAALYAVFPTVIAEMPNVFTSHQFILRLAQQNQRLYVEALHTYRENNQPFASVHGQFSQHLYNFPDLIEYVEHVESTDIFGNPNNCARWRKL